MWLIHAGGESDDFYIGPMNEKGAHLDYTHLSIHVDFYLSECIDTLTNKKGETCYVKFV